MMGTRITNQNGKVKEIREIIGFVMIWLFITLLRSRAVQGTDPAFASNPAAQAGDNSTYGPGRQGTPAAGPRFISHRGRGAQGWVGRGRS